MGRGGGGGGGIIKVWPEGGQAHGARGKGHGERAVVIRTAVENVVARLVGGGMTFLQWQARDTVVI